ncbi:transglycosylase domain-containing protein [Aquisediminimonas sediminicola]|uniref:transglycosylase domain-containing protein n=1 Tax=Alteraquisediminimonas sediminicola TaxID=2676787 RepID=UPI001C8EEF8E|nr:PBP1A family penicillin-binding protein [Aquisediminimonas sediminicola]
MNDNRYADRHIIRPSALAWLPHDAPIWLAQIADRLVLLYDRFRIYITGRSRGWWRFRVLAGLGLVFGLLLLWLAITAPLSRSLQPIAPPRLTLLAINGEPIAQSGAIIDKPVRMSDLPPHVKQAFMAIEDRRFESHWGIDPRGIARATWANVMGGGVRQGGSTITQQLAKITFLSPERSLSRKAHEVLIAFWLEARLTKDEILERYLSNVYFGDNIYGLRAASRHYFSRQPEKLSLSQAAMLAGLVQAPSRLAPTTNPKGAAARAQMVLNAMADAGYISAAKAASTAMAQVDMGNIGNSNLPNGTYFADWAMPQAREATEGGYGDEKIRTTLDARLQRLAEQSVRRAGLGRAQVALVAMRRDGEVVAMVGGRNYRDSSFNRATMAQRQPGSTFKLFVYLAALRQGMTPETKISNAPMLTGTYRPQNAGDHYGEMISLREAFARSSNVAAVRLYQRVGPGPVLQVAREMGVRSPLAPTPSLALGTSTMNLLELTAAYAGVAANHWPVEPHAIRQEAKGIISRIWDGKRSLNGRVHAEMLDLLRAVVQQGTGRRAALDIATYGKTGTSQNNRDALFIGFADDLVVGVWIGNDDDTPLNNISGSGMPARIWRNFMAQAVKGAKRASATVKTDTPEENAALPLDLPVLEENAVPLDANVATVTEPELGAPVAAEPSPPELGAPSQIVAPAAVAP